jgi:hypothetical protein
MLFGEFRSVVEKIRDETANRIATQSQGDIVSFHATFIQISKEVADAFQRVIDNMNCLERDLWDTAGKKTETLTHVSSWKQ